MRAHKVLAILRHVKSEWCRPAEAAIVAGRAGKGTLRNSKNSASHPVRVTSGLRDARGSGTWKSAVSYIDVGTTISLEQSGKPTRVWKRNQDGYSRVGEIVHRQN
jgi:hypothetical protein